MHSRNLVYALALCSTCLGLPARAETLDPAPLLQTLRAVKQEGQGNRAATRAWAELAGGCNIHQVPQILEAIDGASPLAANWLRAAADAVIERELRQNGSLPLAGLESFVQQKQHDGRARRQAFEWIARVDPTAPDRLIPQMLDDPSLELRRDAVARVVQAADKAVADQAQDAALTLYGQALDAARDLDQIKNITDALTKLGHPVDLPRHYGFLQDWKLVGPFDNRQGKGYDVVYPPEKSLDLAAEYSTPEGTLRWIAHHSDDPQGFVDLNKAIGKHMGVVGYVVAEFRSDAEKPAELRLGSQNANKIWLNGKPLASAQVYHANGTMDQYVGRGDLQAGRNVILLKICQNEQKEEWAQDWKFQLRVCDSSGKAILATDRPAGSAQGNHTASRQGKE